MVSNLHRVRAHLGSDYALHPRVPRGRRRQHGDNCVELSEQLAGDTGSALHGAGARTRKGYYTTGVGKGGFLDDPSLANMLLLWDFEDPCDLADPCNPTITDASGSGRIGRGTRQCGNYHYR